MIELIQAGIRDQCGAAINMVEDCIERCTDANWNKPVGRFPFWHVAYHVLFYTDLYLSSSYESFRPQPFHREGYNWFGKNPRTQEAFVADQPYAREVLLEYVEICLKKLNQTIMNESEATLTGPSGFSWLAFPRVQAHLYNIRHIQHHAGQLSAFLNREQGEATPWVRGYVPDSSK